MASDRETPIVLRDIEWIGGAFPMPGLVTGEGEPYRPTVIVWMIPDGPVLHHDLLGRTQQTVDHIARVFHDATREPLVGSPHVPTRVRIDSAELADAVRATVGPDVNVRCAPTPELHEVVRSMRESMTMHGADGPQSLFLPDVPQAAVVSFFATAARLYRSTPWKTVGEGRGAVGIQIPSLGVPHGAVSVLGELGEVFGLVIYQSIGDLEQFTAAAERARGERPKGLPQHITLFFERGADIPPALRREAAVHRLEVADRNAYPMLSVVSEDLVERDPTSSQLRLATAVAAAISLRAEQRGSTSTPEAASVHQYTVQTHDGPVDVVLEDPYGAQELLDSAREEFDIDLWIDDDLDDEQALKTALTYRDRLLARFELSPERATLSASTEPTLAEELVSFVLGTYDAGLTELRGEDFRSFVFEFMPQHVLIEPVDTAECVRELRAFLSFLAREYDLKNIDESLNVLDHHIVPNLRRALADTKKWSREKRDAFQELKKRSR